MIIDGGEIPADFLFDWLSPFCHGAMRWNLLFFRDFLTPFHVLDEHHENLIVPPDVKHSLVGYTPSDHFDYFSGWNSDGLPGGQIYREGRSDEAIELARQNFFLRWSEEER
jgi:hypothetical protein